MIEVPGHVGELNWGLFPYYALTNCVAAWRAWQLTEINLVLRMWFVVGLVGGAVGHFRDFTQVLKGDKRFFQDVIKTTKKDMLMGMCLLALPSLMGIYAMAHLYIANVSGWFSAESNALAALSALTLGFDLYYTSQWGTSFFWHKTHVFAHFTFLISEYAALGYLQAVADASEAPLPAQPYFSFFGIQLVVGVCLEVLLFFPQLAFNVKPSPKDNESRNMRNGSIVFALIFGAAFGLDYFVKMRHPFAYIPRK